MKLYDDDTEVLRLALADGCRERLLAASRRTNMTAFAVWPRLYISHTAPGDSGLSCVEAENLSEWMELISRLPRLLGPLSSISLAPSENVPDGSAHGCV